MPPTYPIGGIQITGSFNSFLFGLISMQSYKYFRNYKDDPTILKMVVSSCLYGGAEHFMELKKYLFSLGTFNIVRNLNQLVLAMIQWTCFAQYFCCNPHSLPRVGYLHCRYSLQPRRRTISHATQFSRYLHCVRTNCPIPRSGMFFRYMVERY